MIGELDAGRSVTYNGLSISEVPSGVRNLGEGVARTRYTLLDKCDSIEATVREWKVVDCGSIIFTHHYNLDSKCLFFSSNSSSVIIPSVFNW
jgi:hypothetical protein